MVSGCPVTTVTEAAPLASPARGVVLRPRAAGSGALVETSYDASGALPRTGGDTGALLGLSALLVLGGGTLVAAGRRRSTSKA